MTWEETVRVLAGLKDPNLLIIETAIATGARISEILGLRWEHVNLETGVLRIEQRYWRGDISKPKSKQSRRLLTLGRLADRYLLKARTDDAKPDDWVFGRTDGSGLPLWDSGVRQALKKGAAAEGYDFPGLGPHSFRRANITWRQEVGGSSIEASKIAGHSTVLRRASEAPPRLLRGAPSFSLPSHRGEKALAPLVKAYKSVIRQKEDDLVVDFRRHSRNNRFGRFLPPLGGGQPARAENLDKRIAKE